MISSSLMIIRGRNSGLHTVSLSRQSFTSSRNICSLEWPSSTGRLYLVQPVQRQLQRVQEPAFPCPVDSVLRVPAGPAVVGPVFDFEVLRVDGLIARLHGRAVLVEMGGHLAFLSRRGRLCGASGILNAAGDWTAFSEVIRLRPLGRMLFRAAAGVKGGFIVAAIGHLRVPCKVVVVTEIYVFDYYYDSGHSQLPIRKLSPKSGQRKTAGVSPAAIVSWVRCPVQSESNLTRLSTNSSRMLPVGPFRCLAMMISAKFLGYSWPGRVCSHSSRVV